MAGERSLSNAALSFEVTARTSEPRFERRDARSFSLIYILFVFLSQEVSQA